MASDNQLIDYFEIARSTKFSYAKQSSQCSIEIVIDSFASGKTH